jgi:hypothetical protein
MLDLSVTGSELSAAKTFVTALVKTGARKLYLCLIVVIVSFKLNSMWVAELSLSCG